MAPLQVAHEIIIELVFGRAWLLLADDRTFVFIHVHSNIVAEVSGLTMKFGRPCGLLSAMATKVECFDWAAERMASGNDRDPEGRDPRSPSRGSVARLLPRDRA
ncbi:hypothetical protein TSA1_19815 [Bradyrhizobium nitroreducens]|uniref:Uncharacterized protein n=1 Tax=Bradyrhizobium nitroreducens TaxID=709803 RepID=A0A2M6UDT9_9BRAD|nr:hypothetical protein [Bradyrhizobium nitroreducens]PIT02749.1 hypothetical protein TSA1_19815 [Bradyrhizobium nitroreducens]